MFNISANTSKYARFIRSRIMSNLVSMKCLRKPVEISKTALYFSLFGLMAITPAIVAFGESTSPMSIASSIVNDSKGSTSIASSLIQHNSVVGRYEDRIRKFSSPEKIYQFFSSIEDENGMPAMSPDDFLRAITPYDGKSEGGGSANSKYNWQAHALTNTAEQISEYRSYLSSIVNGSKPLVMSEYEDIRKSFKIVSKTHVNIINELNSKQSSGGKPITYSGFETMLEQAKWRETVSKSPSSSSSSSSSSPSSSSSSFVASGKLDLFHLVDLDNNGIISFDEFLLFGLLSSISTDKIHVLLHLFDDDDSGFVDETEFVNLLRLTKQSVNGVVDDDVKKKMPFITQYKDNSKDSGGGGRSDVSSYKRLFAKLVSLSSSSSSPSSGAASLSSSSLTSSSAQLSLQSFHDFVINLQSAVKKAKFEFFDKDHSGSIDADELSIFLIAHTAHPYNRRLEGRWQEHLKRKKHDTSGVRVDLNEFCKLMLILSHLDELGYCMQLLSTSQGVSMGDFAKCLNAVCRSFKSTPVSSGVIQTLFVLFDENDDGFLSCDEFVEVFESAGGSQGLTSALSFSSASAAKKSSSSRFKDSMADWVDDENAMMRMWKCVKSNAFEK